MGDLNPPAKLRDFLVIAHYSSYTNKNRWRGMPPKYGKYNTGRNRAQRLRDQGLWNRFMEQAKEFGYARTRGEFFAQRRRRQL